MLQVTIVVGNPKAHSRTRRIAEMIVDELFAGTEVDCSVIDLVEHIDEIFKWPSQRMADLAKRVSSSHLAVFASPTYKATYTGLLKVFLDRYPANGLRGITALSVMTGADFGHSMAPTVNLNALMFELGASVPVRGLYFNTAQIEKVDELVSEAVNEIRIAIISAKPTLDAITASLSMKDKAP
ncbi:MULTISPECIES: NADPH-dependent FMN reductase [unclassified Mesorhizobium]|uniref:NADPH-dependent FMN reductase n=1 Tax=unclassified Mesorhizobium TaxID=325217 RepID=UPI0015E2BBC0|nr:MULTISPECIES: NAD(P)H-dependent oxidoreductase [unclassified Mesorhizobium]